ncbi:MAG: InlB B-repeat-containing protein, partial [Actinomycetota bacterium]
EQNSFVAVHTLSVSKAGEGSGTVTSDPAGLDCGEDCSEGYEEGTAVTLTATPDEGSTFDGWSGDCTGTGTCEVTMDAPHEVTATFGISGTTCGEGSECDEGTLPPGGTLSTVQGPPANPVSPADPFALGLQNVSGVTLTGSIVEEACDGSQEGDALCSTPRIGGSAGNFRFSAEGSSTLAGGGAAKKTGTPAVTVGTLFFDASVVPRGPVRILYQKELGGPVIKLKKCKGPRITECFELEKLASGDQVVTVPFKDDPRVTRG